jgi:hypothetical protein
VEQQQQGQAPNQMTSPQLQQPTPPPLPQQPQPTLQSPPTQATPPTPPEPKTTEVKEKEVVTIDSALGEDTIKTPTTSEVPEKIPTTTTPLKKEEKPEVPVPPLPKKDTEPEHEEIHIPIEPVLKSTATKVTKRKPETLQKPIKETPPVPQQKELEPSVAQAKPPQEEKQEEAPAQMPDLKKQSIDELLDDIGKPKASEKKPVPETNKPETPQNIPPKKDTSVDEQPVKTEAEPTQTESPTSPEKKTASPPEEPKVSDSGAIEEKNIETKPTTETDDVDLQDLIGKSLALNEMSADIPKFNRKAPVKERSKEKEAPMRSFEDDSVLPTADALDIWERDAQKRKKSPPPLPKKPVLEETQEQKPTPKEDSKKQSIDALLDDIRKPEAQVEKSAKSTLLSPKKPKHTPVSNLSALRQKVLSKSASGDLSNEIPETEERPRPESKHASAIADIADKLQTMSGQGGEAEEDTAMQTTPTQEGGEAQPETEQAPEKPTIPHMRTFRSDVQQAVMKNKTSVVDMLSAEEKRKGLGETVRKAPRAKKTSPLSYVLIGASIMLLIAGVSVGGFFAFKYFTSNRGAQTEEIIPANEYVQHDITGQTGKELRTGMNEIKNALQASLNDVTKLRMIERFDENDSTRITFVSPQEFFKKLDTRAPGSLIRTTGDRMTLGVHTLRENEPFWVFSIEQYETAFRGMLEWEDSIREDLSPYFDTTLPPIIEKPEPVRDQTETSATSTQIDNFIERPDKPQRIIDVFKDTVIANREARILTDEAGRTLLIWSIPDTENVLITTNKASFEELVQRMTARVY